MTILDRPRPALAQRPRPTPRLGRWLLRLHRGALAFWTLFVLADSAVLVWARGPLTDASAAAWRQYDACGWAAHCVYNQPAILLYKTVTVWAVAAILVLPFLISYWSGVVLIGKELEHGTARLAWTQSVSPARWLAAKLALPALFITVGCGVLGTLSHLMGTAAQGRINHADPWYAGQGFYSGGPVLVGLALVGLTAGALSLLLWHRAGPGVLATGVVFVAVTKLVPHLQTTTPTHYWPLQLTSTALMLAIAAMLAVAAFRVLKRRTGGAGFLGGVRQGC